MSTKNLSIYQQTTETSQEANEDEVLQSTAFTCFKRLLLVLLAICFVMTLISIPYCFDFTRTIYANDVANMATSHIKTATDSWLYCTVTVAITVTILVVMYGTFAAVDESISKSLFFSFLCYILVATSFRYYEHLYVLISISVEIIMGSLFVIFAILIKRRKSLIHKNTDYKSNQFSVYLI